MNQPSSSTEGYVTGREAAKMLGVKPQTLYAYASRGLVRSVPSGEARARLYARADLLRLKARHDARSGHGAVAASALRWGEPVLETAVSTIDARGPIYRGLPAVELAREGASFEQAAALLWGEGSPEGARDVARGAIEPWPVVSPGAPIAKLAALAPEDASPIAILQLAVPAIGARDADRFLVSGAAEVTLAKGLIRRMAAVLGVTGDRERCARALGEASIARAVLVALGARCSAAAVRAVDRTLLLCADHELNPSTFAVRVAASAGADLYACTSAGLGVLSGPEHGGVADRVEALIAEARRAARPADVVAQRAQRGEPIPGFGHPVYKSGDPRAAPLIDAAMEVAPNNESLGVLRALIRAMAAAGHEPPTVDMGLVAIAIALGLPSGAATALFAIGRMAGWVAHAMEQRSAGFIVRPRARYTGRVT